MEKKPEDILKNISPELLREDIIRDNQVEFEVDGQYYRVRMPTNKEKREAEKVKYKAYIQLRKDPDYMLRMDLIELHKKQGTNVEKLEDDIKDIQDSIHLVYEKMAQIKSENKEDIEKLKLQVVQKFHEMQKLSIQQAELFAFCIEEEVYGRFLEHLVLTCTEIQTPTEKTGEENWKRFWKNQEEFDNDTSNISDLAITHMTKLFTMMRRV